jgi:hypothetical protein
LIAGRRRDYKFVVLPSDLAQKANEIALKQGISLTVYAIDAIEQALRAEKMGTSPEKAVNTHMLVNVQRGAGVIQISRSSLDKLIQDISPEVEEELLRSWFNAGRWYGAYLQAKLGNGECLRFFERALLISWNLDEVEIKDLDMELELRFASFVMSLELTKLLVNYISGVMDSMGYELLSNKVLRGLATLLFRKKIGNMTF